MYIYACKHVHMCVCMYVCGYLQTGLRDIGFEMVDRLCGVCSDAIVWGTALQAGSSRVRFMLVSLKFFIDIILLIALWPWG